MLSNKNAPIEPDFRPRLGRNAFLSLLSGGISVVVMLGTLPYILARLSVPVYGLFSLLLVTTSYVGILDLGFGWTTSRFMTEAIATHDDNLLATVVRVSGVVYVSLGLVGGGLLWAASRWLATEAFNVPPALQHAALVSARIFAAGFPFAMLQVLVAAMFRGAGRLDLDFVINTSESVVTTVAVVIVLSLGGGLVAVTCATVGVQVGTAVGGLGMAWRFLSGARHRMVWRARVSRAVFRRLVKYAATVAFTSVGTQLFYFPNRIIVGAILSLHATAAFVVPLSVTQKLQLVPIALVSAGLPTLTALFARNAHAEFWDGFWRLVAAASVILIPIMVLIVAWAPQILSLGLSRQLGADGAWVLRIGAGAVLLSSAAALLTVALEGAGRPRTVALATAAAGAVNVALAIPLTFALGGVGSALALLLSLGSMFGLIVAWWPKRIIAISMPRVSLHAIRGPMLVALVGGTVWLLIVLLLGQVMDSRGSLLGCGALALAAGYGLVLLCAGPRAALNRVIALRATRASTI